MPLFNKNKKITAEQSEEKKEQKVSYEHWEADFGFLNLILSRKKGITKEFLIKVYSKQKKETDLVSDEEIAPIIENVITETVDIIGESYKNFLIEKYFGSLENLISYITEDVYVDLVSDTININSTKIKQRLQSEAIANLSALGRVEIKNAVKKEEK